MSQNDFNIANQGFPSFRSDLNSALQAIASNSAGTSAPSTTYAYMWWYDSTNDILKFRNADNDAWINFATFDQAADAWSFASLIVDGDLTVDTNTLYVDSTNNRVGVGTSSPSANNLELAHASTPSIYLTDTGGGQAEVASYNGNLVLGADRDGTQGGGSILFRSTGTTQSMQIDSSGNLLIANPPDTFPSNNASGEGTSILQTGRISTLCNNDCGLNVGRHSGTGNVAQWYYAGSLVGSVSVTASATAYNTSSDYRLKEDVQPMTGASERVLALKPVNFAWKADGTRVDGFLAHEAQEVVPEAVTGEKDAVDAEGNPDYQGIDQSKLVPLLTAALQEALQKIEALEARITALEA